MRFIQSVIAAMALVGSVSAVARPYQFDVTGDNTFQVYVSRANTATSVILKGDINQPYADGRNQEKQFGWSTPARYFVSLDTGDVVSIYVHNEQANPNSSGTTQVGGNPSAIVGRLREISAPGLANSFVAGGNDIPTDKFWDCAHRIELRDNHLAFNASRLTGHADDWAAANLDTSTILWDNLATQHQKGDKAFIQAVQIAALSDPTSKWANTNVGGQLGTTAIVNGITVTPNLGLSTPYWIYATTQKATDALVNHGWCRYRIPPRGGAPTSPNTGGTTAPPGAAGDPVFNGFQGQEFQFHGLPDEHFNLISSPQVQLNAHFVYLSSGTCDYNNTVCWTHPGTYMDVMGFSVGESRIKVVAGTHSAGLRLWIDDAEINTPTHHIKLNSNATGTVTYTRDGHVKIHTDLIDYEIVNSDMFLNLRAALKSSELLHVGAKKHTVTDAVICHSNAETHNHQLVEQTVAKKYTITTALHGLIGQTWRNVKVCNRDWMGTVEDYVTESLFGNSYHYNYFQF